MRARSSADYEGQKKRLEDSHPVDRSSHRSEELLDHLNLCALAH